MNNPLGSYRSFGRASGDAIAAYPQTHRLPRHRRYHRLTPRWVSQVCCCPCRDHQRRSKPRTADQNGSDARRRRKSRLRRGPATSQGGATEPTTQMARFHRPSRRRSSRRSLYSIESTSACHEASMMFSATPTVPQVSSPSPDVMRTRVLAPVPIDSSRMRTL